MTTFRFVLFLLLGHFVIADAQGAVAIPPSPALQQNVVNEIHTLFQRREREVSKTYASIYGASVHVPFFDLQENYYKTILPNHQQLLSRLTLAKKNVAAAQRTVNHWSGAAVGLAGKGYAAANLATAQSILGQAIVVSQQCQNEVNGNEVYYSCTKSLITAQTELHRIYISLKSCLPISADEPQLQSVLSAFESGCSGSKPVEAHLLTAMTAVFANDSQKTRVHLDQASLLMQQLPYYPTVQADFCVTTVLLGEYDSDYLSLLYKNERKTSDPHLLWAVGVCKKFSEKGLSSAYFRQAAARMDDLNPKPSDREKQVVLNDCLAHLSNGTGSLPKDLERWSESPVFKMSGNWRALIAKAVRSQDIEDKGEILAEAFKRCPPLFLSQLRKAFENLEDEDQSTSAPFNRLRQLMETHSQGGDAAIFLKRDNKTVGPFDIGKVIEEIKSDQLKEEDLIAESKDGPWIKIKESPLGQSSPVKPASLD